MSSRHLRPPPPCPHLQSYRSAAASPPLRPFRSIHRCLRVRPPGGRAEIRREPDEVPRCGICGTHGPRLFACLACAAVSCRLHAADHAESNRFSKDPPQLQLDLLPHEIAVDVDRAELFCCICSDQVYDADFDAAVVLAQKKASAWMSLPVPVAGEAVGEYVWKKRRRVDYRPWAPDPVEKAVMGKRSSPIALNEKNQIPWGLRGLNNLGSTCFMNSVLQALLHTPPLRNYFLSDRHNRYVCRQGKPKKKNGNVNHQDQPVRRKDHGRNASQASTSTTVCLACDLDAMYSAVFSGDRTPYSPARFLYSWWRHASNLASYEQQDAHEFFISMLDGIHEKVEQDETKPHSHGNGNCCIAHRVFSGILRSDVICTICGFTSTTYDPCIDISLDLDSSNTPSKTTTKSNPCNGEVASGLSSPSTLSRCLEHFTRSERLGSDQKLFCQHCQVRQETLKQMSIRKLPLVTCFHIKRFEHSSSRKMTKKIDSYLQFPFSLNMEPYLSSSILRSRFGNRLFGFDGDVDHDISAELASEFELFAVITHSGKLEAGHYITFLRLSNQWYRCDDAWITRVSESIVRSAQAYMLFYVQKILFYKATEKDDPT